MKMMILILKVRKQCTFYNGRSIHFSGEYTFNHDYDDDGEGDGTSINSYKSVKSAVTPDVETRELRTKLMENYVNDVSKQKYKSKNSFKRIFSKKGKKEES